MMQSGMVYFGLGSNIENALGTPVWHMQQAVHQLSLLGDITVSSLYKSDPMGPSDQPDFYNAVVGVHFDLTTQQKYPPLTLLNFTQNIELAGQREKKRHWGERSIDVDILLYDTLTVSHERLSIPHVGLLARNFVTVPLCEIAPELLINNHKLSEMTIAHDMTGLTKVSTHWLTDYTG